MRVKGEVVGGERYIPCEERLKPSLQLPIDDARVVLPEEPMGDGQELCARVCRALEELARAGDARGDLRYLVGPDDLEAHRPVVVKRVEVQQLARELQDVVAPASTASRAWPGSASSRRKTSTRSIVSPTSASEATHGTPSTSSQSSGRNGMTRWPRSSS